MVAGGGHQIKRLVVVSADGGMPCGMCLQVLREFGTNFPVEIYAGDTLQETVTFDQLMPHAFSSMLVKANADGSQI